MDTTLNIVSPELREMLLNAGRKHNFGENQEVFAGGDKANLLPIVLSGSVRCFIFSNRAGK